MAVQFDSSYTQWLSVNSTPVTGVPLTMACWFKVNTIVDAAEQIALMTVGDTAGNNNEFEIRVSPPSAGTPVAAATRATTTVEALTSADITVGAWQHAAGVFSAINSRAAYLNGGNKGTNTTSRTPAGLDSIGIGIRIRLNPDGAAVDTEIAECAVWSAALTDDEVLILSKGFSPLFVRPQSLEFYAPIVRPLTTDVIGNRTLTVSGSPTASAHPRVQRPSTPRIRLPVTVATVAPSRLNRIERRLERGIQRGILRGAA